MGPAAVPGTVAPPAGTAAERTNAATLTLTATHADLGVQLSEHPQGERVNAVPPGSHGAAIGLKVSDVITKVNDFQVTGHRFTSDSDGLPRFYRGVKKCVILVENHATVSEEAPVALAVLRSGGESLSAPEQQVIGEVSAP